MSLKTIDELMEGKAPGSIKIKNPRSENYFVPFYRVENLHKNWWVGVPYGPGGIFDVARSYNAEESIWSEFKEKKTLWLNIYENFSESFITKEDADRRGILHPYLRLACIQVTYEDGEGLE